MLPSLLVDEIFQFLDFQSVKQLRLVCRTFSLTALPLLLRFHSAVDFHQKGYQTFVKKYGRHIKVLEISTNEFEVLQQNRLKFHSLFPNLRYIALHMSEACEASSLDDLALECQKLRRLKNITVHQIPRETSEKNSSSLEKLMRLYANSTNFQNLSTCLLWEDFTQFNVGYPPFIKKCKDDEFSLISGLLNTVVYSLSLPATPKVIKKVEEIEKEGHLEQGLNDIYFDGDAFNTFMKLAKSPNLVDHCTVYNEYSSEDSDDDFKQFTSIPSLSIHLLHTGYGLHFPKCQFSAIHLSLDVPTNEFPDFFKWTCECFQKLQHLYIQNTFQTEMLPLSKNVFPNLIHFYTNTEQPSSFWPELINAAPNLLYIHTNTIQSRVLELEALKPLLQIVPYRNILGNTSDKFDFITKYF